MTATIVTAAVGLICTLISSVVTFLLTKRKYDIEVDSNQIRNLSDSFDIYKKVMQETYESQNEKIERLQKENDDLKRQIQQLESQMIELLKVTNFKITAAKPQKTRKNKTDEQ